MRHFADDPVSLRMSGSPVLQRLADQTRAAAMYSLIESAKLNGLDPQLR